MWKDKKVLIVDDAPLIQRHLKQAFSGLGFKICGFASNGLEALEIYAQEEPDLVSIDIIMPQMHGVDLYRNLKKKDPAANCVFITCLEGDEISKAFSDEIPASICFPKPANPETLRLGLKALFKDNGNG